jgi:hypothetical protein
MGGDLRGFGAAEPAPAKRLDDLLAAQTGGIKILLRETLDLRCARIWPFSRSVILKMRAYVWSCGAA